MTQPPRDPKAPSQRPEDAGSAEAAEAPRASEARPNPNRRDRLKGMARRIFSELEQDLGEDRDPHQSEARTESRGEQRGEQRAEQRAEGPRPEGRSEARDLLWSLLETGDKAKTEIVKLVAREVRGYLEALELHKDLHHLLTNYSLEIKASVHLKPLADELVQAPSQGPGIRAHLAPLEPEGR